MSEIITKICYRCNSKVSLDSAFCSLCGSGEYLGEVDSVGSVSIPKNAIEKLFRGMISPDIQLVPDRMPIESFFPDSTTQDEIERWMYDLPWPDPVEFLPVSLPPDTDRGVELGRTGYSRQILERIEDKKRNPRKYGRRE